MELRISRPEDLPALRSLWGAAFGDGADYIDHFFTAYWKPDRMLILEADGAARSMAAWFDMPVVTAGGKTYPAAYLYAVATDPACRGRGYAGRLLDFAAQELSRRGFAALTTVPASPSLHHFFARYGFGGQFSHTRRAYRPAGHFPHPALVPVEASQYGRLREGRLAGKLHAACGEAALAYQAGVCALCGGGLYRVGQDGCACVETWDGALVIKELLVPDGQADAAVDALLARHPAARCEVRTPGDGEAFAMLRPLSDLPPAARLPGYFGLAFD